MKRLVVLGLALATFLVSAVAVAAPTETTLTGTAEWTTSTTHVHGTFAGSAGKGTYEGTLVGGDYFSAPDCGPVCQPVTGSITFSSPRGTFTGVVQPGGVVALLDSASTSLRAFFLTLEVVDGTRGYAHANGSVLTLQYMAEWQHYFDPEILDQVNIFFDSGTLTGSLH